MNAAKKPSRKRTISATEIAWLKRRGACENGIRLAKHYGSLAAAYQRTSVNAYCEWAVNQLKLSGLGASVEGAHCDCAECIVRYRRNEINPFKTGAYRDQLQQIRAELKRKKKGARK